MVGAVYNTGQPYSTERSDPGLGQVARYAWSEDYHRVLGQRLESLLAWMREGSSIPFEARAYVDTGPVQERVYAQYAGLGWIGKNSCLINPEAGSWVMLGAVLCSLPLDPDTPGVDQCGTCTLCLDACPTQAIVEPHVLDATRCVSYFTVEYRKAIPVQHRTAIGNRIFGCDVCQEVCPWNGRPATASDRSWSSREDVNLAALVDLWRRSDRELEEFIGGTPMTRAGVTGLRRNLAVALGNSGDPNALDALRAPGDASTLDPIVAEHVAWAETVLSSSV
jgi:epoxyqueuosine reductase